MWCQGLVGQWCDKIRKIGIAQICLTECVFGLFVFLRYSLNFVVQCQCFFDSLAIWTCRENQRSTWPPWPPWLEAFTPTFCRGHSHCGGESWSLGMQGFSHVFPLCQLVSLRQQVQILPSWRRHIVSWMRPVLQLANQNWFVFFEKILWFRKPKIFHNAWFRGKLPLPNERKSILEIHPFYIHFPLPVLYPKYEILGGL